MSGSTISQSATRIESIKLQSSAYGVTVPLCFGLTRVAGNLLDFIGFKGTPHTSTESAGGKGGTRTQNTTYTYSASVLMSLGHGSFSAVPRIWRDSTLFADVPGGKTALQSLGLSLIPGSIGQPIWSPLATLAPAKAIGYSGQAVIAGQDYDLGEGAQVQNHLFEVRAPLAYSVGPDVPDVDPADMIAAVLPNALYGAAFPAGRLRDMSTWSAYNRAAGLLCSPAITEQVRAADMVTTACKLTNSEVVWSGQALEFIPYGDTPITGNGRTYTPNTTPLYDLNDDHFLDQEEPVTITQKDPADRYNHFRIEYRDRGPLDPATGLFTGQYALAIAEWKDQADIDINGLRSADVEEMHWICDAAVAQHVAQLRCQRSLYIPNTFSFKLPWTFALVGPMDLLTLTDPPQALDHYPVRVTKRQEDEDGTLTFTAEDFPLGIASATLYPSQLGSGFQHDYNAAPGHAAAPVIFEAPGALTVNGLELYVAATGTAANWGGCHVWVSLDGANYRQIGDIEGGTRMGTVYSASGTGGVVPVALLRGALLGGSAADAAALNTLCYVGGAHEEFFSFQTAGLTSAQRYDLGGLVRGVYGTAPAAHEAGASFVRIDDSIAKSGPIDLGYVGRTIHIKLTSYNVYGGGEEELSTVADYTYTITGSRVYGNAGAAALTGIGAAVSDNVLTPGEKGPIILDVQVITGEKAGVDAQAAAFGITTELAAYDGAVKALQDYLATLTAAVAWNDVSGNTAIVGQTFRDKFAAVYLNRQALQVKISAVAATRAAWNGVGDKPANLAALTGVEAIRNADIVVGGANLLARSNDFSTFSYGSGSTIQATGLVDPLGTAAATRILFTGNTVGERYRHFTGLRPGATYTASVWVLRESGGNFCLSLTNGQTWSGSAGAASTAPIGAWTRLVVTLATSTGVVDICLGGHSCPTLAAQSPAVVRLAFSQFEEGNATTQWKAAPEDIAAIIATAQQTADTANRQLATISDDNVLDRTEKPAVRLNWETISNDRPGIDAQASAYGITTERTTYDAAIDALANYLSSIGPNPGDWYKTDVDSPINRDIFRDTWKQAYAAEQALLNKISQVAGTLANWTGVNGRPLDLFNMEATPTFENGSSRGWGAPVVPVIGKAWTQAMQVSARDTFDFASATGVSPGEIIYAAADLDASTATGAGGRGLSIGYAVIDAAGVIFDFLQCGTISAGTGWTRVSGSRPVPAGSVTLVPWVQLDGSGSIGTGRLANIYLGRAQPGATLGADWASNVANIPYASIYNNDDSVALGFSMEDWPAGQPFPAGWNLWNQGPVPIRETVIVREGRSAVRWQTNGQAGWGIVCTSAFQSTPLPVGTFLQGSVDFFIVRYQSGQPGALVRVYTNAALTGYREVFVIPPSTVAGWQRVPWSLRTAPGERIYAVQVYLMPSPDGRAAPSVCDIVIDNFLFALFDSSTDNTAIQLLPNGTATGGVSGQVTISGLGYAGDLNATFGANWGTNVVGAAAVDQAIAAARVAANLAQSAADTAQGAANTANSQLAAFVSDGVLSRIEKPAVILDWQVIAGEQAGIDADADNYLVPHAVYDAAIGNLAVYLAALGPYGWADLNGDTPVDGPTLRAKFAAVYAERQAVRNAISAQAKARLGALATLSAVDTGQINDNAVTYTVSFFDAAGYFIAGSAN